VGLLRTLVVLVLAGAAGSVAVAAFADGGGVPARLAWTYGTVVFTGIAIAAFVDARRTLAVPVWCAAGAVLSAAFGLAIVASIWSSGSGGDWIGGTVGVTGIATFVVAFSVALARNVGPYARRTASLSRAAAVVFGVVLAYTMVREPPSAEGMWFARTSAIAAILAISFAAVASLLAASERRRSQKAGAPPPTVGTHSPPP